MKNNDLTTDLHKNENLLICHIAIKGPPINNWLKHSFLGAPLYSKKNFNNLKKQANIYRLQQTTECVG
jgi:hypothetical protein